MSKSSTDHDRLFKELLTAFFVEFIELFFPQVAQYIDKTSIVFVDKELLSDGKRREADLVVRVRFKDENSFFVIHTESQAQHRPNFSKRLLSYFVRLHEKFSLPVYPIALFSFDSPKELQPNYYSVSFPDLEVLRFSFKVIQLNRLSWRRYLKQPNPVAAALMAKMHIAPKERAIAKLECLRMLTRLKVDSSQQRLISGFIDTYLQLTERETELYIRGKTMLSGPEQEAIVKLETSWFREGLQQGRQEATAEVVSRLLVIRLGILPSAACEQIQQLTPEQLATLVEQLLGFASIDDLEQWLRRQKPNPGQ